MPATDNFKEKLNRLPDCKADEYYRLADYIELRAIANLDGFYSKSDYIKDAKNRKDLGEGDIDEEPVTRKNKGKINKDDTWEKKADDIFRTIECRAKVFRTSYPFKITTNNSGIRFTDKPTIKQLYYIFLLYSGNLRYTGHYKSELTSSFETLSVGSLKSILPKGAEVRLFGSSNVEEGEQNDEWVSDKLWEKLVWLSKFLNADLRIREEQINKYNKGDNGIDIVAKMHFNDSQSNLFIFFAQCACSPHQWVVKQASTSSDIWDNLIELNTVPNRLIFIPQSYRNSDGTWYDKLQIHKNVLIDRERLLATFNDEKLFKSLTAYPIVSELMAIKESNF